MVLRIKQFGIRIVVIVAAIYLSITFPAAVSAAAGPVSYLNQPRASAGIPLSPVNDDIDITMVPYTTFDLGGQDLVLSAQAGNSPVSDMCTGGTMTQGDYVCSTFSVGDNVSGAGSGLTFSKSCRIDVVAATYPMFFHGGDLNGDGRINIYRGEWPSFSDATGQLQPSTEFYNGEMGPGDEYHYTGATNYPPEFNPDYGTDGSERTEAEYIPEVLSAGDSVDQQPANPASQDSKLAFPRDPCDESPLESTRTECASGRKVYNEVAMLKSPDNPESTIDCETTNGQSNCGMSFWYPDNEKQLGRPASDPGVCPGVENVFPNLACINARAALFGWIFSFSGFLQNIECRLRGDCYTNVRVMMSTESLLGANEGCEEPCVDVYSDTLVASQRPPNYLNSCSNYGTGQNAPCWSDTYVGTPGLCRVCGVLTSCTFVWKNWLKDNYDRQRTENVPCEETGWINFMGRTYWMCNFEETDGVLGYFEYVQAVSTFRELLGVN